MDALDRTLMTINCRDTDTLPKVEGAGRIIDFNGNLVQIMHNGLKIVAGGYHGDWMAHVIRALRGHHEPQEELLFSEILRLVRHNSLMVELGSFWAYYSNWFLHEVPGSRCICIEPDPQNVKVGMKNIRLNGFQDRARFLSAWVGGEDKAEHTLVTESTMADLTLPCVNMDRVMTLSEGQTIELLHLDIQGAELSFLMSMQNAVNQRHVRFAVVSTHHSSISGSKTTHDDCVNTIRQLGGTVLIEHDVQESYSGDGLIIASFFPQDANLRLPQISRNSARHSLFPEL